MTSPLDITFDLSWSPQARADHLAAHDQVGRDGWSPDVVETLRVTWHRDCPRCPSLAEVGELTRSIRDPSGRLARFEPVDRSEYDAVRVDVEHYTGTR